jgi:hypothetical protein
MRFAFSSGFETGPISIGAEGERGKIANLAQDRVTNLPVAGTFGLGYSSSLF